MLSEDVINKLSDRVASRMTEANTYILKKIGESIGKIKDLTPSQAQQLGQILKYGGSYEGIAQKIAELSNMNIQDVYDIFKQVAKKDYGFAKQFYDYRGVDYIPYEQNLALQRQVQSLASLTANTFENICNTRNIGFGMQDELGNLVFRGMKDTYYEAIDRAVLAVSQGKDTFESQMYKTIKELGGGGLRTISDKTYQTTVTLADGTKKTITKHYTRRLDSAIRMNMQDSLRNLHNEVQKQVGEEFGSDGVEISAHSRPAPDHAEVQGHQFSNEEFEKFQTDQDAVDYKGVLFPAEFEGVDRRSISEYNCRHRIFSIILGVSEPLYTQEQLQQIIDDNEKGFELDGKHYTLYEGTQLQRQLETEIRKAKDTQIMANASGNEEGMIKAQQRITMLKDKYNELSQVSGIPTQLERARVSGYTTKGRKYNKQNIDKPMDNITNIAEYIDSKKDMFDSLDVKDIQLKLNERNNFNDKPTLVDEKTFDKLEEIDNYWEPENNKEEQYVKVYRGWGSKEYYEKYIYGENSYGDGGYIDGVGTYATDNEPNAWIYAEQDIDRFMEIAIPSNARFISREKLSDMHYKIYNEYNNNRQMFEKKYSKKVIDILDVMNENISSTAVLNNYDITYNGGYRNWVILNRKILKIKK